MKFAFHDLSAFRPAHLHGDLIYNVRANGTHQPHCDIARTPKYSFLDRYSLNPLEIKQFCPADELSSPSASHLGPWERIS